MCPKNFLEPKKWWKTAWPFLKANPYKFRRFEDSNIPVWNGSKADSTKSGNLKSKIALGAFLANNILFGREAMIGRSLFDETLCCKLQTSISSLSEVWDWAPNPRLQMIRKWSLKLVWVGDYFSKPDLFMRGLWIFFPVVPGFKFFRFKRLGRWRCILWKGNPEGLKSPSST